VALHRVGEIVGVFGVRGELKLIPTEAGEPLFEAGARFFARPHEHEIEITAVRSHKGRLLVRLEQAADMEAAQRFVGATLFAERERIDEYLAEDEILDVDLIGTMVRDASGKDLGEVLDVEHYPSSAMLVVGPRRALIPYVKAYIVAFDRGTHILTLDLPEGLLD
jgi:16S rRNA processing protein RimM